MGVRSHPATTVSRRPRRALATTACCGCRAAPRRGAPPGATEHLLAPAARAAKASLAPSASQAQDARPNADPHAAGCAAIAEAIYVDQLDRAVFDAVVGETDGALYTRLQRLAVEAREDVATLVQGNAGGLYASPAAAAARCAPRVCASRAPHGTGRATGRARRRSRGGRHAHAQRARRDGAAAGRRHHARAAAARVGTRRPVAHTPLWEATAPTPTTWRRSERGPLPGHAQAAVRDPPIRRVAPHAHRRRARARVCARPRPRAARAVRRRLAAAPPRQPDAPRGAPTWWQRSRSRCSPCRRAPRMRPMRPTRPTRATPTSLDARAASSRCTGRSYGAACRRSPAAAARRQRDRHGVRALAPPRQRARRRPAGHARRQRQRRFGRLANRPHGQPRGGAVAAVGVRRARRARGGHGSGGVGRNMWGGWCVERARRSGGRRRCDVKRTTNTVCTVDPYGGSRLDERP